MTLEILPMTFHEPDYITLTAFERNFDPVYWRKTFREIWSSSIYMSVAYLVLMFSGQFLMRNRKPFKLNGVLVVWNVLLSIMSIWAVCRTLPEFTDHLTGENGLYHTICDWKSHNKASALWGFVIMVSKVVEFGDTAFVVLRKGELKFIHYFHHVLTAVGWWFMYAFYEPVQMWYVVMNASVHSVMYPYYALRAMKISIPKSIAMAITAFQILQMFVGMYLNLYSVWVMYIVGTPADCPDRYGIGVLVGFSIYFSFAILFFKFFITNYVAGKGKVKSKKV